MEGWPRADILALLGIVATIVVAVVAPLRKTIIRSADRIAFELGFPARRLRAQC